MNGFRTRARARGCTMLLAGGLVALVPAPALAAFPETVLLDTHAADPRPTVAASTPLEAGHPYAIVVEGTYSNVKAGRWALPFGCGTTLGAPMLPSPGTANGPVGFDAEVMFAQTRHRACAGPYPRRHKRFQIDLGDGFGHRDALPYQLDGPSHSYTYAVFGTGAAPSFRLDDSPASDNHGVLRIVVLDAEPGVPPPPSSPTSAADGGAGDARAGDGGVAGAEAASKLAITRRCISRRAFVLRLGRAADIRSARVTTAAGKRLALTTGRQVTARVELGKRARKVKLRIRVVTSDGEVHATTRTFARCTPRSRQGRTSDQSA